MADRRSRLVRLLAPVALLLAALALVLVLMSSDVSHDDDEGGAGDRTAETARATTGTAAGGDAEDDAPTAATYRVRAGDTLAGIAERTGVELEELQQLNPELDPQALVAGQRIKLR